MYYTHIPGGFVFITRNGEIVYSFPGNSVGKICTAYNNYGENPVESYLGQYCSSNILSLDPNFVLKEEFIGGKTGNIVGESSSQTKVSYFIGQDPLVWKRGLEGYEVVNMGELFDGIEVKLRVTEGSVEKLFYIRPGAESENIRIRLRGSKDVRVNQAGDLEIRTNDGNIVRFTRPSAYQIEGGSRKEVQVFYKIVSNQDDGVQYTFDIGEYDKGKTLIIDPLIASTYVNGGSLFEEIEVDPFGNVFLVGETSYEGFPSTSFPYRPIDNVMVIKMDSGLTSLLAVAYIGGRAGGYERLNSGYGPLESFKIDSDGNLYILGYTTASSPTSFPTTPGSFRSTCRSSGDSFIVKLSNDLSTLLASTCLQHYIRKGGIVLDNNGNIYIGGETSHGSTILETLSNSYDKTYNGGVDFIILKLSGDLSSLIAGTFFGTTSDENIYQIMLDPMGNVLLLGRTSNIGSIFPPGTPGSRLGSGSSGQIIAKFNSDLTALLAGVTSDGSTYYFRSIVTVLGGEVYVLYGSYTRLIKLDSNLNLVENKLLRYTTTSSSMEVYQARSINDGVYIFGWCTSITTVSPVGVPIQPEAKGLSDGFIAKFDHNWNLIASTHLGGSGYDIILDAEFAPDGSLYVVGETSSYNFPVTPSAFQTNKSGSSESYTTFVSKLSADLSNDNPDLPALAIYKRGNGTGTVSSSPEGIECGDTCSYEFPPNTTVTLSAVPDNNVYFLAWTGDCTHCGSNTSCQVMLASDKICEAWFVPKYSLSISSSSCINTKIISNPPGINCGSDCWEFFPEGTLVTLTAIPTSSCYPFRSWGGDCSFCGSNPICQVVMTKSIGCYAVSEMPSVEVNLVGKSGLDYVNIDTVKCYSNCKVKKCFGQTITLTAVPSSTSVFVGWGRDCEFCGNNYQCVLLMDRDRVCDAIFATIQYSLTVAKSGTGTGTVVSSPSGINCGSTCQYDFISGTSVTLTATPASDSVFAGWSGDCATCGSVSSCNITLSNSKSCVATFQKKYSLTITKTGSGSITSNPTGINCGSDCSEIYTYNTSVTLTATPSDYYSIIKWGGDCASCETNYNCSLLMLKNFNCTAEFRYPILAVYKTGSGSGLVSSDPSGITCGTSCSSLFPKNVSVTLTMVPSNDSVFNGWGADCSSCGHNYTCTVLMSTDKVCNSYLDKIKYPVSISKTGTGSGTVTSSPAGIDCGSTCVWNYDSGSLLTLTATPSSRSVFAGWTGDCMSCGNSPSCQMVVDRGFTCQATFDSATLGVSVSVGGGGKGRVVSSPSGIDFTYPTQSQANAQFLVGTRLVITATAENDSYAVWNTCPGTISGNLTKTATCTIENFNSAQSLIVGFTKGSHIEVTPPPSSVNGETDSCRSIR